VKGNVGFIEYNGQVGYSKVRDLTLYQTLLRYGSERSLNHPLRLYDSASVFNLQFTAKIKPA
jgi:hypothetical protein